MNARRAFNILTALVALSFLAGVGGAVGLWVGDRSVPVRVMEQVVLTPTIEPGGEFQLRNAVIRDKLCDTKVDRFVYDSAGKRYSLGVQEFPNGTGALGPDNFTSSVKMPMDMAPGPARYVSLVCYQCNPIHAIWPLCAPPNNRVFDVVVK